MAVEVIMPKAGMAMEEGKILRWLKAEGDKVEEGEFILEIETDKVSMEIESPGTGVLLKILHSEGEIIPIAKTIAFIGEPGEKLEENSIGFNKEETGNKINNQNGIINIKAQALANKEDKVPATPKAKSLAYEKGIDLYSIKGTGKRGEILAEDVNMAAEISATPLAKRIALDLKVYLSQVNGSGYRGKVTKEDVLSNRPVQQILSQKAETAGNLRKPLTGMRKVIAERMLKSHLEIPPVTIHMKADVTELMVLRKKINDISEIKISINDFILKTTANALTEFSYMNVNVEGNEIIYIDEINLGMAVGLEDGLIVPVIGNADKLSLKEISQKAKELANRAREGKLSPDEYKGGTFTISNMGMFDVVSFNPIINQPQSAILGVCTIEEVLKMSGEKIEKRNEMGLSLTFDHRVMDGTQSAVFLKRIKYLLENPDLLI